MKNYFFVLVCILFFSCGKKSELAFEEKSLSSLNPDQEVTYAMVKSELLTPHCLSCHSDISSEAKLDNWITAGNPENSPLYTEVKNGSMPKNSATLNSYYLELIRNYIEQKAPISSGGGSTTPSTGISYAEIKAAVLTPYRCVNCHSVSTESALSKWMNKTSPEKSLFYTTIKSGSMPQGGSKVPSNLQEMVLQYIKDFAAR